MERLEQLLVDLCNNNEIKVPGARLLPMSLGAPATDTKDNPIRGTIVDGDGKRQGVLFLASPLEPGLVQQSVDRASAAKELLNESLGSVIIEPMAKGVYEELSFVCWPWCTPLSQSKLMGYIHRTRLRPNIFAWLDEVTQSTQQPASELGDGSGFADDLQRIADDDSCPREMRTAADCGLDEMRDGAFNATHTLEHGDFWMGNILRPQDHSAPSPYRFSVIDWAGARTAGYPFVDLIRFGLSSRMPTKVLSKQVLHHCDILGCSPQQAKYSIIAAMGYLGDHLGYFPRDRYLTLAAKVFNAIVETAEGRS
jgi:hypothetical protein